MKKGWYKLSKDTSSCVYLDEKNRVSYGVTRHNPWETDCEANFSFEGWTPLTNEEAYKKLVEVAKDKGVWDVPLEQCLLTDSNGTTPICRPELSVSNRLWSKYGCIMNKGIWAEPLKESKLSSEETLLKEAKEKYPVGTIFDSTGGFENCKITSDSKFRFSSEPQIKIYDSRGDFKGCVYSRGTWATIKKRVVNEKIYTIEDLRTGVVGIKKRDDSEIDEIARLLKLAFPDADVEGYKCVFDEYKLFHSYFSNIGKYTFNNTETNLSIPKGIIWVSIDQIKDNGILSYKGNYRDPETPTKPIKPIKDKKVKTIVSLSEYIPKEYKGDRIPDYSYKKRVKRIISLK